MSRQLSSPQRRWANEAPFICANKAPNPGKFTSYISKNCANKNDVYKALIWLIVDVSENKNSDVLHELFVRDPYLLPSFLSELNELSLASHPILPSIYPFPFLLFPLNSL